MGRERKAIQGANNLSSRSSKGTKPLPNIGTAQKIEDHPSEEREVMPISSRTVSSYLFGAKLRVVEVCEISASESIVLYVLCF